MAAPNCGTILYGSFSEEYTTLPLEVKKIGSQTSGTIREWLPRSDIYVHSKSNNVSVMHLELPSALH